MVDLYIYFNKVKHVSVLRRRFSIFVCVCGVRPQRFFLVSYSFIVSAFYVSSVLAP